MKLIESYQDKITGAICGLDRVRFRGTLRWLASKRGLATFMAHCPTLLKDFAEWVSGLTTQIRSSCQCRPERLARQIAMEKGIAEGSICMFSVVEPCIAPTVKGNKATRKLEVTMAHRKCVWVYHYLKGLRSRRRGLSIAIIAPRRWARRVSRMPQASIRSSVSSGEAVLALATCSAALANRPETRYV